MSRPLPRRLEEELEELRRSFPLYKPETHSMDDLLTESKERCLYDSILGKSPSSTTHSTTSEGLKHEKFDTVLTSRLVDVEQQNQQLRITSNELRSDILKLQQENSELKSALGDNGDTMKRLIDVRVDNTRLQLQVMQMEQFLAEYNLAWVGYGHHDDINQQAATAVREDAGHKDHMEKEICPAQEEEQEEEEEDKEVTEESFDADQFLSNLVKLNEKLNTKNLSGIRTNYSLGRDNSSRRCRDRGGDMRSSVESLCARLVQAEEQLSTIHLAVYRDGLMLKRGPFRRSNSVSCRSFVKEVAEGFFPIELRDLYPEGTVFNISDKRHEVYEENYHKNGDPMDENVSAASGKDRASGRSKDKKGKSRRSQNTSVSGTTDMCSPMQLQQLSYRLPPSVISVAGDVVQVRKDVTNRLQGRSSSSRGVSSGEDGGGGSERMGGADCNKIVMHIPSPAALACMWDIGMQKHQQQAAPDEGAVGSGGLSPQKSLGKDLNLSLSIMSMPSVETNSVASSSVQIQTGRDENTEEEDGACSAGGLQALGSYDDLASVQMKWYNDTDVYIVKMYGSDVIGDLIATLARHVSMTHTHTHTESQVQQASYSLSSDGSRSTRSTPGQQRGFPSTPPRLRSSRLSLSSSSSSSRASPAKRLTAPTSASFSLHSVFPG